MLNQNCFRSRRVKNIKSKILMLSIVLSLALLMLAPLSVYSEEAKQAHPFTISEEVRISSQEMYCYNFSTELPKLIITDTANPLVAFSDEVSGKLILFDVTDREIKFVYDQPKRDYPMRPLEPLIFTMGNNVYFALLNSWRSEKFPYEFNERVQIFLFDRDTKKMVPHSDQRFKLCGNCSRTKGIYPVSDKLLLTGNRSYMCWRQILSLIATSNAVYHHNVSHIMDGSEKLAFRPIDERGCHEVTDEAYDSSTSGAVYAAWKRYTRSAFGSDLEHLESVYYSMTKDGMKWSEPLELNLVKTSLYRQIEDVSVASAGGAAMIMWSDTEAGAFFSEVRDGAITEKTKISDMKMGVKYATLMSLDEVLSDIKIASDKDGNAYALWTKCTFRDYQLYFKARINGQWTEEILINKGHGSIEAPDMKVDKNGTVHITYLRPLNPDERRTFSGVKQGCYYMKLERQRKN